MYYMPYPFPWPQQMPPNNDKPKRGAKRPGRRERTHMSDPDFMKLVRKHEAVDAEIKDWLKSKEKKDEKKKEEAQKLSPAAVGMFFFLAMQATMIGWLAVLYKAGFIHP